VEDHGRPVDAQRRALFLAGLGAAACARARPVPAGVDAVVRIVGPWEIGGLQPAMSGFIFARMEVAETLVNARDDGILVAGLAERWQESGDGLAWRFDLRNGARFHDGTPVVAAAVVRSLRLARTPPAVLDGAPITSIDADGPHVVVIRLARPFASLPALLAHSSAIILADSSFNDSGRIARIVGTGTYQVVRLAPPNELEVAIAGTWDGPSPAIRAAHYLVASRAETRALMAETGRADLAFGLDPASLQRLRSRPHVTIHDAVLPRTAIVKVNAGLPGLANPDVRRALSLAIDRVGIATALMRDPGLVATQLFPPAMSGWHDTGLDPHRYAPDEARVLLAGAGFDDLPDTRRGRIEAAPRLILRTFPDRPELPLLAIALQDQWRRAGLHVRVAIGNAGDVPLGHRDGSLHLALVARGYGIVPDPAVTLARDFARGGGEWGAMGWEDPAVIAGLDRLLGGRIDAMETRRIRSAVTRRLHEALPVIPVAWYRQNVAASSRLAGVTVDPLERSYRLSAMRWVP